MIVTHITPSLSPRYGGLTSAVRGMSAALIRAGVQSEIITTHDPGESGTADASTRSAAALSGGWRFSPAFRDLLEDRIRETDIAHIHSAWEYTTIAAARLCRKMRKPFVFQPHGMLDEWSMAQGAFKKSAYWSLLLRPVLRKAGGFICTTRAEFAHSKVMAEFSGRVFIVPLGVDEDFFDAGSVSGAGFRKSLGLDNNHRIVLFLGRVHFKKRPDTLIRSLPRILESVPGAVLVIAGHCERTYEDRLKSEAETAGVESLVRFLGPLKGAKVREAFRDADVFILPSFQENFGMTIVEAMASGCPVIVSNKIDLADDIRRERAGFVCAPDPVEIAGNAVAVLKDASLRDEMISRARKFTEKQFRWSAITPRLISVYEDIISGSTTSPDRLGKREER